MGRPLAIAFHGLQGSPALEDGIRKHVAKLEQHCMSLVSCAGCGGGGTSPIGTRTGNTASGRTRTPELP